MIRFTILMIALTVIILSVLVCESCADGAAMCKTAAPTPDSEKP